MDAYTAQGYRSRGDYLRCLALENDVDVATVRSLAELLGPSEDFDGLVTMVQDLAQES